MIKPQLDLEFSQAARDAGMAQAIDHADQVIPNWRDNAMDLFRTYVNQSPGTFMMEDFRLWVCDKISDPPSNRAFGAIAKSACRAGLIVQVGFAPVKSVKGHCGIVGVWKKA